MQESLSLFVYGSLTDGMVHYDLIRPYVKSCEEATACGFAYRLPVGYPAFIARNNMGTLDGAAMVPGYLVKIDAPDLVWGLLDNFFGVSALVPDKSLHWRETVKVYTAAGESSAYIYAMNPAKLPKNAELIIDGDWRKSLKERPPLTTSLTEKQATYIKRLKASTGREIVPIDLALYRELLKLDLIVDKGRRLALTKFGKEVAHYL